MNQFHLSENQVNLGERQENGGMVPIFKVAYVK